VWSEEIVVFRVLTGPRMDVGTRFSMRGGMRKEREYDSDVHMVGIGFSRPEGLVSVRRGEGVKNFVPPGRGWW